MPLTLGLDIGTTGIKAGLLDLDTFRIERLAARPLEAGAEIQPAALWGQALSALAELLAAPLPGPVAAIGIAGQMHGAVLYGHDGEVLAPILTWQDSLHTDPAILEHIRGVVRRAAIDGLGADLAPGYTGVILCWLEAHRPTFYRRIARFTLIPDFIRARLLGRPNPATDPTNAFGTGLLDVRDAAWHTPLIRALGLDPAHFPAIRPSHALAGRLSPALAARLGLPPVPIVTGGGDNQVGMLGSGLLDPGSPPLLNIGTAAQLSGVIPSYRKIPGMETRSFFDGQSALVGASLGGGASYRWLREELRRRLGPGLDYPGLDRLAAQAPPGAGGLVYCTGPTRQDPARRPGFSGDRAHAGEPAFMARAVLEGVLSDLQPHFDVLRQLAPGPYLIGGGAGLQKSPTWAQIAANFFGLPLRVIDHENVVFGAALLAARGVGLLPSLPAVLARLPYKEYQPGQPPLPHHPFEGADR